MILIFSVNDDYSTSRVINWLIHMKKAFIRLNENSDVEIISLTTDDFTLKIDGKRVHSAQITKIWYRRGGLYLSKDFSSALIKEYLSSEIASLVQYFYYVLDKKPAINNFRTRDINKLHLMDLCKKYAIAAPAFLVTSCKNTLLNFYHQEKQLISKPLTAPFSMVDSDDFAHLSYTAEITLADINDLPEQFVPTFFQKNIIKTYEIRAFYLNGDFYAMAIFSQNNKNTNVDFRNYDYGKPNRLTPYQFPRSYERKIQKLLDAIGLNCASFDVVYAMEDQQYYFLDLNPIGQFGMVSNPCNYHLEKEIASTL
ncbi:grasp-with-spasm system ATP-grasp peptide maturase [Sphingobacteriaceae bacterium GW460-11-11-14-LB5]|nr:grasp-with-spasm system ATP-grasp peptide maturase [Sphingobacteriaceae bacterium GW460-11-11-14-LB5]